MDLLLRALLIAAFALVVALLSMTMLRDSIQTPQARQDQATEESGRPLQDVESQSLLQSLFPDASSFFSFLLVLVTAGLVVIGMVQAKAARDAAAAAKGAVELAERTAERQLRAYVLIKDVNLILIENDTALDVTVVFLNSGQTPGFDLRTSIKVDIKSPPASGSPYGELAPPEAKSIIGPNSLANVGPSRMNLRPGALDELLAGTQKIYIWGRVDYVDAFGKDRHFSFQGTNGAFFENKDLASGRINFRGWQMQPSPEGYKAN